MAAEYKHAQQQVKGSTYKFLFYKNFWHFVNLNRQIQSSMTLYGVNNDDQIEQEDKEKCNDSARNGIDSTSDAETDIELVLKQGAIAVGNDTAKHFQISQSQYKTKQHNSTVSVIATVAAE